MRCNYLANNPNVIQISNAESKFDVNISQIICHLIKYKSKYTNTRSLGARWAPTSSWRPFGPAFCPSGILDFVLHALRALRPCDPRTHSVGNPTNFMEKSNKFHREIQQISLRNPTDFMEKSNKFHRKLNKFHGEI